MARSLKQQGWSYVCRTDIQGFYGHIRRGPLMRQLKRHVSDPVLLNLVRQYLHYSVERGGEFYTPRRGICRGCALSPLLAGFCLWAMDTYLEAQQPALRYVRYMDDIVIFTRTRWHLRRAVRTLNAFFASGGYRQHPDKTFIGKTDKGFDWMGIQFNGSGITGVAPRALTSHRERCCRLYEQAWRYGKKKTRARVAEYVKRWTIWRTHTMHQTQCSGTRTPEKRPKRTMCTLVRTIYLPPASLLLAGLCWIPTLATASYDRTYQLVLESDSLVTGGLWPDADGKFVIDGPPLNGGPITLPPFRATVDDGTVVWGSSHPLGTSGSPYICLTPDHGSTYDSNCAGGIKVTGATGASAYYKHACLSGLQPTCTPTGRSYPVLLVNGTTGTWDHLTQLWGPGWWIGDNPCPTCSALAAPGYNPGRTTTFWALGAGTTLASGVKSYSGKFTATVGGEASTITYVVMIAKPAPSCQVSAPGSLNLGDIRSSTNSGGYSYASTRQIQITATCLLSDDTDVGSSAAVRWSAAGNTSWFAAGSPPAWLPNEAGNGDSSVLPRLQLVRSDGSVITPDTGETIIHSLMKGINNGSETVTVGVAQASNSVHVPTRPGAYSWDLGYQIYLN
ncbi:TPA: reverse transcriptase domain-containing protein [Enterobacter ludwigii]